MLSPGDDTIRTVRSPAHILGVSLASVTLGLGLGPGIPGSTTKAASPRLSLSMHALIVEEQRSPPWAKATIQGTAVDVTCDIAQAIHCKRLSRVNPRLDRHMGAHFSVISVRHHRSRLLYGRTSAVMQRVNVLSVPKGSFDERDGWAFQLCCSGAHLPHLPHLNPSIGGLSTWPRSTPAAPGASAILTLMPLSLLPETDLSRRVPCSSTLSVLAWATTTQRSRPRPPADANPENCLTQNHCSAFWYRILKSDTIGGHRCENIC